MKFLKFIISLLFLIMQSSLSFSQVIKYGDLFEFAEFNWNKDADEIINCDEFFAIADTVTARSFINYDCKIFPNIKGDIVSITKLQQYPSEAQEYQISGIVKVKALIDKNGNLYCYSIKTELGNLFKNQAESILRGLEFEKAICNGNPVAYITSFQVRYEFPKGRKEKRLERKIKNHAL